MTPSSLIHSQSQSAQPGLPLWQVKLPLRDREEEYGAPDWDAVSAFTAVSTLPHVLHALGQKPASNHKHTSTLQLYAAIQHGCLTQVSHVPVNTAARTEPPSQYLSPIRVVVRCGHIAPPCAAPTRERCVALAAPPASPSIRTVDTHGSPVERPQTAHAAGTVGAHLSIARVTRG